MTAGLISLLALVGPSLQASNDTTPEGRRDGWGMLFHISCTKQVSSDMQSLSWVLLSHTIGLL